MDKHIVSDVGDLHIKRIYVQPIQHNIKLSKLALKFKYICIVPGMGTLQLYDSALTHLISFYPTRLKPLE